MKALGHMALLMVLAVMVACNGNKPAFEATRSAEVPSKELSAVDSLLWVQPDSALAVLMDYWDGRDVSRNVSENTDNALLGDVSGNVSTYDRHYANLLLAELLYKNYYDQTNRPELQQAVAYFDSLLVLADQRGLPLQGFYRRNARRASAQHTAFLDARAHYINGVGYYEQDSVVDACKEYLTALEVMEKQFEEEERIEKKAEFMAYTYTRLTDLFSDLYLHEQAIYFAQQTLSYYREQDTPSWYFARMLCEIGTQYDMMEELDSASCYYNRAADVLDDTTLLMYRDNITRQAFLSYRRTHQPKQDLPVLYRLAGMAVSNDELMARYLVIGNVYFYENQFDSAYTYLRKVYENMTDRDSRMLSAERLQEMSFANGDTLLAKEYALTRSRLATMPDQEGNTHASLTALCLQYEQNKQEAQHRSESKRTIDFIVKAFMIVALVIIIMGLLLVKQNKSWVTEHHAHKIQQAALAGRLKKSRQELRELKSQIKQQGFTSSDSKTQAISFVEEPVCQMIIERVNEGQFKSQMDCSVYKDYALSKEQLSALREAANCHFSQFTTRLVKSYPKLTSGDLNYCCLYLLDMSEADISALMQRAYSTVSDRSRKLKTIFGCTDPLSITLHRIANNEAID